MGNRLSYKLIEEEIWIIESDYVMHKTLPEGVLIKFLSLPWLCWLLHVYIHYSSFNKLSCINSQTINASEVVAGSLSLLYCIKFGDSAHCFFVDGQTDRPSNQQSRFVVYEFRRNFKLRMAFYFLRGHVNNVYMIWHKYQFDGLMHKICCWDETVFNLRDYLCF